MIVYIWLLAVIAAIYFNYRQLCSRMNNYGIKFKNPLPLLGNVAPVLFRKKHLVEVISELYREFPDERFIFKVDFTSPGIIIKDLDLVKKIAVKDYEYFLDHAMSMSKDIDPLFSRTLFALKGQEWKDMRSTLSPAFTSSKIRNMVPFIVEVGDQMITCLKKELKESGNGYIEFSSEAIATRYANDVIASCAFGLQVDSHTDPDNHFYKMGTIASNYTFKQILTFIGHGAVPRLMKLLGIKLFTQSTRDFFKNLVMNTMSDREERGILRPDMIHLLMEAKKGKLTHEEKVGKDADAGFATVEESDVGKKAISRVWTDNDLTAQALIFFLAGYKTVSTTMAFLLYELALNPEVQDKLAQEIREYDQKNGGKINYNTIQSMTYLDMAISEVLRRWPPAFVTDRLCIKDYDIGPPNGKTNKSYIIKAGESITIPITAFHQDPKYFPDPLKFDPERFSEENRHKILPNSYMPFGIGPRNCIGSRFALCEVKVMIYQLLLHMEVAPCERTVIPAELMTGTFNLKLKDGHFLKMKLRK